MSDGAARAVTVAHLPIELGPFLKLAGLARSGGEAKALTSAGRVAVNGYLEHRRARALEQGDRVSVDHGDEFVVTALADDGVSRR